MTKKQSILYQPLLLRIFHNFQAIFTILAMVTAFWTYNTYDGRWGKINFLPDWNAIEGIHGTFGLWSLLLFPVFTVYVIHRGKTKLIQKNTPSQLKLFNKPIWWYSLHRIVNTLSLFSLVFAVFSGKMMDEKWLPEGELNHIWYYLHLISLLVITLTLALHLLMSVKIGGYPLLLSMINLQIRDKDSWRLWKENIINNSSQYKEIIIKEWAKLSPHFKFLEMVILLSILGAWLFSFIK
ncbi:cytochrome b/b6 domain-containing protein [Cyanobacterium sp. IPPAS B-1200]|uniref:cytochrome b/b6 domain-containing protein n=1 Tax=Cyanobacterium sp. IPPAS B-1200 TaxID=1562720 RepID=UPI0008527B1E|nr:cytochrome b/b6 domain-containing protein [Cyanobacterium sp. IPPAS B-1200]OEJ78285.1 cytochrome B [Cyanobacterium sp. IPPAS B-1200]